MEFEEICRTCLGSTSLKPIFKNKEHHERFSLALANTTGLKVELDDGLPQNICIECMSQINASLKFRAKCKDAEAQLLQIYQIETLDTSFEDDNKEDIVIDNEKKIESEYLYVKTKIDIADNGDDKSMVDLNGTKFFNLGGCLENTDITSCDIKPENITILENKVLDVKKYKRERSKNKNKEEIESIDSITNEDDSYKIELRDSDAFFTDIDSNYAILSEVKTEELDLEVANNRVKCRICKQNLSVRSIDAHMNKKHPGADERKAKCELCDEYVLKTKMNRHRTMVHGTECTKCIYCNMEFSNKGLLIEHVVSCTYKRSRKLDKVKKMSECDICHKTMQRASLKMHQKVVHAGLGPICDHCGRKFGNNLRLSEHLRARHGHDKYECAHCAFSSATLAAMRNHERRHRGEKPYECEACDARFHASYLLAQHKQTHRIDKPAKCDLCPAAFKVNNGLHMHKALVHSNSTYQCTLCEKEFRCRNYALRHLRTVHGYSDLKSCEIEDTNAMKIV